MTAIRSSSAIISLCVSGLAVSCGTEAPTSEETRIVGQMPRAGQAEGDSFFAFDVVLTNADDGPAISCERGKLDVQIEVSTDGGETYQAVESDAMNVVCVASAGTDIALVVDNSGSESGQLEAIQAASEGLVGDTVELGGRASIVRVSTESRVLQELSKDGQSLQRAIAGFTITNGWTALYDGVRLGNETLGRAVVAEDQATFRSASEFCDVGPRRSIVVFTDARENNSSDEHASDDYPGDGFNTSFDDVQQLRVRGTPTPIYTVGFGDDVDHTELARLATESGGKHHALSSLDDLTRTFANIRGYDDKHFRVCADLGEDYCGRLDVRMSYAWTDGEQSLKGDQVRHLTVPCSDASTASGSEATSSGRVATILMTVGSPGVEQGVASELVTNTVRWVSPVAEPRTLVVLDDSHHDESAGDAQVVVDLLRAAEFEVDYIEEPRDGIEPSHVAGYDVVWFSNPGYPMDDELSFETLRSASAQGIGVVLQGDDMTQSYGYSFDMSPLTRLVPQSNGTQACELKMDAERGDGQYLVRYAEDELMGALAGSTQRYGDDIDWAVPVGDGESILATASVVHADSQEAACADETPVVVYYDPMD